VPDACSTRGRPPNRDQTVVIPSEGPMLGQDPRPSGDWNRHDDWRPHENSRESGDWTLSGNWRRGQSSAPSENWRRREYPRLHGGRHLH
jgi:hypothetical protein